MIHYAKNTVRAEEIVVLITQLFVLDRTQIYDLRFNSQDRLPLDQRS